MAVNPKIAYPGQTDNTDPVGYPWGRAKNRVTPSDNSGTPLEEQWLSDWWGFQAACLAADSLTPTGTPDTKTASQVLDGIRAIIKSHKTTHYWVPLTMGQDEDVASAMFGYKAIPGSNMLVPTQRAGDSYAYFHFNLPFAQSRLVPNGLRVHLLPAGGHSALPAIRPKVSLWSRYNGSATVNDLVTNFSDESADVTAYQLAHVIQPTMDAVVAVNWMQFLLRVDGESGANAVDELQILGIELTLDENG